ncbi:hypothetical protein VTO42DRAFT_7994 [Malbranchea cinnamomea]
MCRKYHDIVKFQCKCIRSEKKLVPCPKNCATPETRYRNVRRPNRLCEKCAEKEAKGEGRVIQGNRVWRQLGRFFLT